MINTSTNVTASQPPARRKLIGGLCVSMLILLGAQRHSPARPLTGAPTGSNSSQIEASPLPDAPAANQSMELIHNLPTLAAEPVLAAAAVTPGSATPAGESITGGRVVWMQVTAYCGCKKCCGPHARGLTASGRSIDYNDGNFVAADTSILSFGTKLLIPGYADGKAVEVIDRGSAIKGNHVDVFFPTHEEARAWGRKWIAVTVLD